LEEGWLGVKGGAELRKDSNLLSTSSSRRSLETRRAETSLALLPFQFFVAAFYASAFSSELSALDIKSSQLQDIVLPRSK